MANFWTYIFSLCIAVLMCQGQPVDVVMRDQVLINDRSSTTVQLDSGQPVSGHLEYCTHMVSGDEGFTYPGYSLKSVHVVMSPGQKDISAVNKLNRQTLPQMTCAFPTSTHLALHPLRNFRQSSNAYHSRQRVHPDFNQFHPTFPTRCSKNHLTQHGFIQLARVGEFLHSAYLGKRDHKRLRPDYKSIHVESSYTRSSYQSALGLLHALLPQKQFEKTKIHKSKRNFCDQAESKLKSCDCAAVNELAPHMSQALGAGRFMFKSSFPDLEKIQQIYESVSSDFNLSSLQLFQILMQYECNNITPPCNDSSLCFVSSANKLAALHKMTAEYLHSIYRDPTFRTYSELRSYPFLEQLISRSSHHTGNQSMFIYMGDQFFLQLLRTSLTVLPEEVTPLASRLVFEVFRKNDGQLDGGRLYFRVLYNGQDVTEQVGGCRFNMENQLCSFDTLVAITAVYRSQYLNQCDR